MFWSMCLGGADVSATVSFRITDGFGMPVTQSRMQLRNSSGEVRQLEGDLNRITVPMKEGSYEVTVESKGFFHVRRDVEIRGDRRSVVAVGLCVAPPELTDTSYVVNGSLLLPKQDAVDLKVIGLFNGHQSMEAVPSSGQFSYTLDCEGTYMLVAIKDGMVIGSRVVDLPSSDGPIVFDLRRGGR